MKNAVKMLHIVNGDSVGHKLKQTQLEGDILIWREILTHGPIFPDFTDMVNLKARAAQLQQTLAIPEQVYIDNVIAQHDKLQQADQYEQIILWFEYDLFDMTILVYLLKWFSTRIRTFPSTRLQLLCIDSFPGKPHFKGLGELSPEQLLSLVGTWHEVSIEELGLGAAAWDAYASSDPMNMQRQLDGDMSAIPLLRAAWTAHLQRFPASAANGLNRIESEIVTVLEHRGPCNPAQLFQEVSGRLPIYGLGDLEFWNILSNMSFMYSPPVLNIKGDAPLPTFLTPAPVSFHTWTIELRSQADRRSVTRSVQQWLGGVGWSGGCEWEWNAREGRLMQAGGEHSGEDKG